MKRIISLLLLIIVAVSPIALISCADDGEDFTGELTLNVYNWGEYISDGSLGSYDTNAEFEAYYYAKTGRRVRVNYTTYATNEDMYAKISSGAGSYDVIIPSDYMIQKMIAEDLLLPLNFDLIPNFENIEEDYKNRYYDPENAYSIPYTYGMVGIIYNTTMVDPEDVADESWSLLWNEKYRGKILQFNNPRDGFGTAMYYKHLDVNSKDPAVWKEAQRILSEQKHLIQAYVSDEIFNKMQSGSAAIGTYYAGDYLTMAEQNDALAFYYPKEGTNVFIDAMCIPKCAKNVELANEYINFMLSEEPAVANALYIGYASPNKAVKASSDYYDPSRFDDEDYEGWGEEEYAILYGQSAADIEEQCGFDPFFHSFDDETQELVNSLWEGLKTESSIEPWVRITAALIVVGVIGYASYIIYIRKARSREYRLRDREIAKRRKEEAKSSGNK